MFNLKSWLNFVLNPRGYVWIDALLIKETPKAILIEFDGKQAWLPKAWILQIKRNRRAISIKISQFHWAKTSQ